MNRGKKKHIKHILVPLFAASFLCLLSGCRSTPPTLDAPVMEDHSNISIPIFSANPIEQDIPSTPMEESGNIEQPEESTPEASMESPAIPSKDNTNVSQAATLEIPMGNTPKDEPTTTPSVLRDNTPVCLVPKATGEQTVSNEVAIIDFSNSSEGYVMAKYTGSCPKVKLRVTAPDTMVYTYTLQENEFEVFPLSIGSGNYEVTIYENITGDTYAVCLYTEVEANISNEFSPFLYPNQYVNFNRNSQTVQLGAELAKSAQDDLEVVTNIYDYLISNISYDDAKASNPPSGYVTNVDSILASQTGICLDYAAVMTSMLRSQRIPTRLEVGYAKTAYHAWISVYIKETGWLNGIISFDGNTWTLVDPTFGASTDEQTLRKFIGDGSNYILQKLY